jgi:hypothetical protein
MSTYEVALRHHPQKMGDSNSAYHAYTWSCPNHHHPAIDIYKHKIMVLQDDMLCGMQIGTSVLNGTAVSIF